MLSMWSSSTTQTTTIKAKKAQRLLWKMKNWRLADALWTFFSLFHGVINFMKLKPLSFCQSWVLRAWLTFCGYPHVSRPVPHLHEKLESWSCTEVSGYPEPKSPLYCFLFPPPPPPLCTILYSDRTTNISDSTQPRMLFAGRTRLSGYSVHHLNGVN